MAYSARVAGSCEVRQLAIDRLSSKVGKKGKAGPHAAYITRTGEYAKFTERGEKLEAVEAGNMPAWAAHDPLLFWQAADAHERQNGTTYREFEIALPRELSEGQRLDLVREFVAVEIGDTHPYQFAIHTPKASDGGEQPHVHLMFSERRLDGIERDPDTFFKRANKKAPERGGAVKGFGPNAGKTLTKAERVAELKALRARWEETANRHLAAAGVDARIDMRSYADRGIDKAPEPKLMPGEWHRRTDPKATERAKAIHAVRETAKEQKAAHEALSKLGPIDEILRRAKDRPKPTRKIPKAAIEKAVSDFFARHPAPVFEQSDMRKLKAWQRQATQQVAGWAKERGAKLRPTSRAQFLNAARAAMTAELERSMTDSGWPESTISALSRSKKPNGQTDRPTAPEARRPVTNAAKVVKICQADFEPAVSDDAKAGAAELDAFAPNTADLFKAKLYKQGWHADASDQLLQQLRWVDVTAQAITLKNGDQVRDLGDTLTTSGESNESIKAMVELATAKAWQDSIIEIEGTDDFQIRAALELEAAGFKVEFTSEAARLAYAEMPKIRRADKPAEPVRREPVPADFVAESLEEKAAVSAWRERTGQTLDDDDHYALDHYEDSPEPVREAIDELSFALSEKGIKPADLDALRADLTAAQELDDYDRPTN